MTSAGMWIQHTFAEANFRISPGLTSFLLLFPFLNGLLDPFSTLHETHAGCIYGLMLKMMLAGVTLVESRGCVNLWSMEYSSVCVVSSRHQIESPDEKRIEYTIQGHDH